MYEGGSVVGVISNFKVGVWSKLPKNNIDIYFRKLVNKGFGWIIDGSRGVNLKENGISRQYLPPSY